MSEFQFAKPGLNSVGQYQMSGIPYVSSSIVVRPSDHTPMVVGFPTMTKFITVTNEHSGSNAPLRVGFTSTAFGTTVATDKHYFVLNNGESYTGEFRVSKIFLAGDGAVGSTGSIIAGLTQIETGSLGPHGGDNWASSDSIYKVGLV